MGTSKEDILAANKAFYDAFSGRDVEAMDAIWAKEGPVFCAHPGWEPLRSREHVMRSWQDIFRGGSTVTVRPDDESVSVRDSMAFVLCYERHGAPGKPATGVTLATNVFVLESGQWRMVHHHGGGIATRPEVRSSRPPPRKLN